MRNTIYNKKNLRSRVSTQKQSNWILGVMEKLPRVYVAHDWHFSHSLVDYLPGNPQPTVGTKWQMAFWPIVTSSIRANI